MCDANPGYDVRPAVVEFGHTRVFQHLEILKKPAHKEEKKRERGREKKKIQTKKRGSEKIIEKQQKNKK